MALIKATLKTYLSTTTLVRLLKRQYISKPFPWFILAPLPSKLYASGFQSEGQVPIEVREVRQNTLLSSSLNVSASLKGSCTDL